MAIESNYHQHTKDSPTAGWIPPAFIESISSGATFSKELGYIIFTPFLTNIDTTIDALSIQQRYTRKSTITFGFYSSDKYGLPNKLISNIGENKGFTWVTNDDDEKEPTKTPYIPFKSDGENEVPWWNPFMEEGSDDVSVKVKKGIFWVGTIVFASTAAISAYYPRPDFPGLKKIGSPGTVVYYRMDSDELLPDGIDDLEKISLIFPKTLKQENFEFKESSVNNDGIILVSLHIKKEG